MSTEISRHDYTDDQLDALARHARVVIAALKQTYGRLTGKEKYAAESAINDLDSWCWHVPSCGRGERCVVTEINWAMRLDEAVEVRFTHNVKTAGGGDADPEYIAKVDVEESEILEVRNTDRDEDEHTEALYARFGAGDLPDLYDDVVRRAREQKKKVA